jgi:long-chain acyl-CoA synthetase
VSKSLKPEAIMLLTTILENAFRNTPFKRAVTMHQGYRTLTLTYKQVYEYSCKIAHFLAEHGIKKGDPVVIIAVNSPQWMCVFWACLLRGAVVVPLNTQSTSGMIELVVNHTQAAIAFVDRYTHVKMPAQVQSFIIDYVFDRVKEYADNIQPIALEPDDLVEIMYTSGTTGEPKGVMLNHRQIFATINDALYAFPQTHDYQRILSILPLSHIFEQVCTFLGHFYKTEEIVCTHTPTKIMYLMHKYRITKMMVVPEFLHVVMSRIRMQAENKGKLKQFNRFLALAQRVHCRWFSCVLFRKIHKALGGKFTYCVSGGAHLSSELAADWQGLGITVLAGYGLTETASLVSTNTFASFKDGSVGKPIKNVLVRIASDGEILVKGPNVFSGYYKNTQKTVEAFTDDGWFKTGDLGELDSDGFLYIRGRKQYRIKGPGGQNVFPEDIEAVLQKCEGVQACCVVGLEHSNTLSEIHASIILQDAISDKFTVLERIIAQANSMLATYQHINGWSLWPAEDFPRTATKKIKKNDVIAYLLEKKSTQEQVACNNGSISALVRIIAHITNIDMQNITPDKRLMADLKLDSLMRVELVARIEDVLQVSIDEALLTQKTTVLDVQDLIDRKQPVPQLPTISRWSRSWWAGIVRYITQPLFFLCVRLFVKLEVKGLEHLKNLDMPVVFMPNHISYLDSAVLPMALPRSIRLKTAIAAARDMLYEKHHLVAWLFELVLNTFPIQRVDTPDAQLTGQNVKLGLEYIGQMLDWGYSIILYPEGRLGLPAKMHEFKQGSGLIALEMNCLIVPVKITGTADLAPSGRAVPRKRGAVTVTFGKPLAFNHLTSTYGQATQEIRKAVQDL